MKKLSEAQTKALAELQDALQQGTADPALGVVYAEPIIGPGRVFDELPPETCPCPSCVEWRKNGGPRP